MARYIVADDDEEIRSDVAEMIGLAVSGAYTDRVADGAELVKRVLNENYDAVFTDINMPVKDGLKAAMEIMAARPGVPIYLMSGNPSESVRGIAEALGINHIVDKASPDFFDIIQEIAKKHAEPTRRAPT